MEASAANTLNILGVPDPSHWDIKKLLKKYSYVFIVMYVLNKVGIAKMSKVIKAIAQVQKVLDEIMNNLNELKRLLQALQNLGFGSGWDPTKHTEAENEAQMKTQIQNWLGQDSGMTDDSDPPKKLTNQQAMQYIWNNLYKRQYNVGTKKDPVYVTGLLGELKYALENKDYPQQPGMGYSSLQGLNGSQFDGTGADWQSGGKNLLDVLNGTVTDAGTIADIMKKAFCYSWYNKTGQKPSDSGDSASYNDDVGDVNNQFENTKQVLNGLNTTESSDLSMFSQNLTSEINEGQQMIQYGSNETKTYVSNQAGRG